MSADVPVIDGSRREALRLAANALSLFDRAALARSLSGEGERDLDRDLGYPKGFVPREAYQDLYDRHAIANRVVNVYPRETWRVSPSCYETEDPEEETPFEVAIAALGRSLRPEKSYHQDEQGGALWEYLSRLDELSGVGQYGVMLLGLNDDLELSQPARFAPGSVAPGVDVSGARATSYGTWNANGDGKSGRKLTFLRVFPESMATVNAFDGDERSPRFGQPTEYTLTFVDPQQQSTGALGTVRKPVHWTRVLHVADNLGSSEVFGVPRMRPVLNNLLDLKKVHGGSAEMYYQGALPGWSFETNPMLGGDVEIDLDKLREAFRKWKEGLQRFMVAVGASIKSLAPQVVDPSPQIDKQLEAICIQIGVPVRIFKGSERGQLASGQDDDAWNDRCRQRQLGYVTPRIIVPFVDRLIALGVLPAPEDGYSVSWPDLATRSDEQRAAMAQQRSAAVVAYGNSAGAQDVMTPTDFWVKAMGYTEQEATALAENADKARAERQAEEAKAAAEQARQAARDHARQLELAKAKQPPQGPAGPTGPGASGGADGQPPGGGGGNRPFDGPAGNVFCPTGPGGGVDPSCAPGGGGGGAARVARVKAAFEALPTYDPEDNTRPTPFPTEPVRPYVRADVIEGALLKSAPVHHVPLAALTAHQDDINRASVAHAAEHPGEPIQVVRAGGKLYIDDGTNRAAAALLAGEHTIPARVFDYDPATHAYTPVPRGGLGLEPRKARARAQNYDPSQPRLPGGGTGAGRWAAGDALAGLGRLDARRHAGTHGPASDDVDPPFVVTDARPWETAAEGLPEEEATLPLSALHAAKPRLSGASLRHFAAGGGAGDAPAPRVWLTPDGRHVIEDGAHRLAADRLRGRAEARVRLVRWRARDGGATPPAGNEAGPLTLNEEERAALAPEERALWTGLWQERQRLLVRARGLPPGEAAPLVAEADGLRARAGALRQAARGRVTP